MAKSFCIDQLIESDSELKQGHGEGGMRLLAAARRSKFPRLFHQPRMTSIDDGEN
jgi:hypothetical protein